MPAFLFYITYTHTHTHTQNSGEREVNICGTPRLSRLFIYLNIRWNYYFLFNTDDANVFSKESAMLAIITLPAWQTGLPGFHNKNPPNCYSKLAQTNHVPRGSPGTIRISFIYLSCPFVVSDMVFARAVWIEDDKHFDGVIPKNWIQENIVRWPKTHVQSAHKKKLDPMEDWLTFQLVKIKMTSGMMALLLH